MFRILTLSALSALLAAATLPALAQPGVRAALLDNYRIAARQEDPGFRDFSARRGEAFFHAKNGDTSCASCHTDSPKQAGHHAKTGKAIEALAPVANAQRLSDPAKVEKWFKRNCNDVLQRACSAREKGDFVAWLVSVK
jgi:mono/diheme cytochrome c family protein